jgi:hypothetical protein
MSKGVEYVLVIREETIVLPRVKSIVVGVPMAIKVRYDEPRFNQQNENIVRGVPRDWSRRIHSVNKVPKLDSPRCTYCHQIGH